MYNPIYQACEGFLKQDTPKYTLLFSFALEGIRRLMETYSHCSIIGLCLSYYYCIIDQYMKKTENGHLFYRDMMSVVYTDETVKKLNDAWTEEKQKIVLEMMLFLSKDEKAEVNIRSLETIMENNDVTNHDLFLQL
jgi:hypothetical protein